MKDDFAAAALALVDGGSPPMTARAIVSGALHKAAEERTSKAGNQFATFTIITADAVLSAKARHKPKAEKARSREVAEASWAAP
jgi:hypothetical protein